MTDNTSGGAVAVVRAMYEAFANKDEEALRRTLHPEVEWIQCSGFPGGAHRRSADDVVANVLYGLQTQWEGFKVLVDDYLDAGDRVVALGRYEGTHTKTGRSMLAIFAHVYTVIEGRITRFVQITDTHEIVKAMPTS